jgi:hypothetical protein
MAIYKLIANGSFGPDEIEVMKAAYEAALVDVGVTNSDDPITELIAKSIVTVLMSKLMRQKSMNGLSSAKLWTASIPTRREWWLSISPRAGRAM